jgi:hypothetical protein
MLPLLRKHNVRLVEVARNRPTKRDGITVLQDTRQPRRLHLDGVFKLSDENRVTGTMPQLSGVRKCSVHAKGEVLDAAIADEIAAGHVAPGYRHVIAYAAEELDRVEKDNSYTTNARTP